MMRLIFKTSSVTPDFFTVFNIILSFSNCSQSFKKICTWELLGANVLKLLKEYNPMTNFLYDTRPQGIMVAVFIKKISSPNDDYNDHDSLWSHLSGNWPLSN